jgi:hypothetical protein
MSSPTERDSTTPDPPEVPLLDLATMAARLDSGEAEAQVLSEYHLSNLQFAESRMAWLKRIAAELSARRPALQQRYAKAYVAARLLEKSRSLSDAPVSSARINDTSVPPNSPPATDSCELDDDQILLITAEATASPGTLGAILLRHGVAQATYDALRQRLLDRCALDATLEAHCGHKFELFWQKLRQG